MFNFYVVLAGHDNVSDAARTITCRRKIKPHDYKQKYKKWRTFQKHGIQREKPFEDFRQKKNRNTILDLSKQPSGTHGP